MILLTILFVQTYSLIIFHQNVCYFYHHTNYWSPDLLKHPITEKQCEIVIDYHTVMFDDIIREDVKKVENVKIVEVFNFKGNYNSFYKSFLENEKFVKKECNSFIEFRNKDYFDTSTMKCEKRIEKFKFTREKRTNFRACRAERRRKNDRLPFDSPFLRSATGHNLRGRDRRKNAFGGLA